MLDLDAFQSIQDSGADAQSWFVRGSEKVLVNANWQLVVTMPNEWRHKPFHLSTIFACIVNVQIKEHQQA